MGINASSILYRLQKPSLLSDDFRDWLHTTSSTVTAHLMHTAAALMFDLRSCNQVLHVWCHLDTLRKEVIVS